MMASIRSWRVCPTCQLMTLSLASLSYMSVDDVVAGIVRYGQGTLIETMDIHQAYRNISVHPSDRSLLGMQWKGLTFVDSTLPLGLLSAPLIFSAVVDAAQWARGGSVGSTTTSMILLP